ncbi:ricin-type beta-trefoil lectin domain protein [Vibrio mangrovi]|nr:ricin-type beta-trefoil lectin domain protein [Vibrio mangrovi]MDW6005351.1 ricin-type beta-trefoil lectin domain protein [Vibrio mangrovi]
MKPIFKAGLPQDSLRFDQLYYIQPHNTYQHGDSLIGWLDAGYRSVELDVIDRGNWENNAKGPSVSHDMNPGNVNCSAPDNDRLGDCLDDIVNWMNVHTDDLPLVIFVDMKSSWDPLNAWKSDEVVLLDQFISNYLTNKLGSRFFTYQDLLAHLGTNYSPDYRARLKAVGWPNVASMKGKAIIVLTGGHVGDVNDRMETAMTLMGSTQSTFLCPDIDAADPNEFSGAIDSISDEHSKRFFCGNVAAGDHYQITANRANEYKQLMHLWSTAGDFKNTDYAATWIALAHGVSAIGWDIDNVAQTPDWTKGKQPQILLVGERRSLPGYFKIHPKIAVDQDQCLAVEGSRYNNGSDLRQELCTDQDNQQFVYTAEGQLRPKGNNKYCVDFNTGSADAGDKMHLWDCDGGNSEKWAVSSSGQFLNRDKNYAYCMDVSDGSTASGNQWQIWPCNSQNDNQIFYLEPVADWGQSSF